MPKNKPLKITPFTLFMKQRKSELERDGVKVEGGWKGVAQAISDEWTEMTDEKKKYWKNRATKIQDNTKREPQLSRQTSRTPCYSYEKIFSTCEVKNVGETIKNYFCKSDHPLEELTFPVVHFNTYCRHNNAHIFIPAEYAIGNFSILGGLNEYRFSGSIIDPGKFPATASRGDANIMCEKTGLISPPFYNIPGPGYGIGLSSQKEFNELLEEIVHSSIKMIDSVTGRAISILFTPSDDDIASGRGCIMWLMMKCNRDFDFEILPLTSLMVNISSAKTALDGTVTGIWVENHARTLLGDSFMNFRTILGCKWHKRVENAPKVNHCCTNIVKKSIYLALTAFCVIFNFPMTVPTHRPDLDKKEIATNWQQYVGKLEFRQRFGMEMVDEDMRKVLRKDFVLPQFLDMLKNKFPDGLKNQPQTIIWPKKRDIEVDLNYAAASSTFIRNLNEPEEDDDEEQSESYNWDW